MHPQLHQAGPDRREQRRRLGRRENEPGVGRRLFEHLQERVGGLRARGLRDQPLRFADHEHLPLSHRRAHLGAAVQHAHQRQKDPRHPVGGRVQRLVATRLDGLREQLLGLLRLPVLLALGPQDREEPVNVGVRQGGRETAGVARAARLTRSLLAQQPRRDPQAQPLFPHAGRAGEEERRRQAAGAHRGREPGAEFFVAEHRRERHGPKIQR